MENFDIEKYVSENVFSSENGIKVTFPLTGEDMPNEFKYFISDIISSYIAKIIEKNNTDNIFKNGKTEIDFTKTGKIVLHEKLTLTLTLLPDGTFTNEFEVKYSYRGATEKYEHQCCRIFKDYDIPISAAKTFQTTALRLLKRSAKKGLKIPQFT